MLRNLILSGGVAHDYARTSPMLAAMLAQDGVESVISDDLHVLGSHELQQCHLLTLNCVWWTCSQTPEWYEEWRRELSAESRQGLSAFFRSGKGLMALHAATICFDDFPEYAEALGARWEWGVSTHAPLQEQPMRIADSGHPITQGLADFRIFDELYTDPVLTSPIRPLVVAHWNGKDHPMLWARSHGNTRVCYNALGHGPEAFEHPTNQVLLRRGALWCAGLLD